MFNNNSINEITWKTDNVTQQNISYMRKKFNERP